MRRMMEMQALQGMGGMDFSGYLAAGRQYQPSADRQKAGHDGGR